MVLYDSENAKFTYETEGKLLYQKWLGFSRFDVFKIAIDELMKIARTNNVEYIISDTSEMAILTKESTGYATAVMPELIELGMKKMAFVLPTSIFVEMSVNNFTKDSEENTSTVDNIAHFDNVDKAREWLAE